MFCLPCFHQFRATLALRPLEFSGFRDHNSVPHIRVVLDPVIVSAYPATLEIYNLYKQILISNDNPPPGGSNTKSLVYLSVLTINTK